MTILEYIISKHKNNSNINEDVVKRIDSRQILKSFFSNNITDIKIKKSLRKFELIIVCRILKERNLLTNFKNNLQNCHYRLLFNFYDELFSGENINVGLFTCSFIWRETKEGYDFWREISSKVKSLFLTFLKNIY